MINGQYRPKGLNLRSNHLSKVTGYASDIKNLVQDSRGDWIKRNGFDDAATQTNALDSTFYKTRDQHVCLNTTALRIKNAAAYDAVNFGGNSFSVYADVVSFAEMSGCLYWSDPSGANPLWKYDGYMTYKAGLPICAAVLLANAGGGVRYFRIAYKFIDLQGNEFFGDYVQLGPYGIDSTFTVNTLNSTLYYGKHGSSNTGGGETVSAAGTQTLTVTAGHNYVANDWVRAETTTGLFIPIRISVAAATQLTFDSTTLGAYSFEWVGNEPIERRIYAVLFSSANAEYGYVVESYSIVNVNAATFATVAGTPTDTPMEDVYDTNDIKGLPPQFKYITVFGNTLVGLSQAQEQGRYSNPGATSLTSISKYSIYWSDLSLGSSCETFAPFDYEIIGKSDEGDIVAGIGSDDALIVIKERQVYYISGVLTGRQFSSQSAQSGGIGGAGHKGIAQIPGGAVFVSPKGLYLVSGGRLTELSDLIEPFFTEDTTGLTFASARMMVIAQKEKMYCFIPATATANDAVLVYDYYWKDWTIFRNYNGRKGFYFASNLIFHMSNEATPTLYQEQTAKNDNASAIDAYYKTEWDDSGMPGFLKKFTKMILLSLCNFSWTAYIKTNINWDSSTDKTNTTKAITSSTPVIDLPLSMAKCRSLRLVIGNNTINESMKLSGYEVEKENVQKEIMA